MPLLTSHDPASTLEMLLPVDPEASLEERIMSRFHNITATPPVWTLADEDEFDDIYYENRDADAAAQRHFERFGATAEELRRWLRRNPVSLVHVGSLKRRIKKQLRAKTKAAKRLRVVN